MSRVCSPRAQSLAEASIRLTDEISSLIHIFTLPDYLADKLRKKADEVRRLAQEITK